MSNINKVTGPGGPTDPQRGTKKTQEGNFEEFMRIDEVGNVDPDQTKKRRQRAEEKESSKKKEETETPQEKVLPFTEKQETPTTSPLTPAMAPLTGKEPLPPSLTTSSEGEISRISHSAAELPQQESPLEQKRAAEKKGTLHSEPRPVLDETTPKKSQQPPKKAALKEEEIAEMNESSSQVLPPLNTPTEAESPLSEEKQEPLPPVGMAAPIAAEAPTIAPTPPSGPLPSYTQLSPPVLELFERMVGVITLMQVTPGVSETTIHLTSEQFSSSIFFGTQIIISEDKNAQNQFNINIHVAPHAAPLLEENLKALYTAFERGGYAFEVKQIRIHISNKSEGSFKRKEKAGEEEKEDMP